MIESRRGIYVRKTRRQPAEEASETTGSTSVCNVPADNDDRDSIQVSRPEVDYRGQQEPLSPMTMSRSSRQRSEDNGQPADHPEAGSLPEQPPEDVPAIEGNQPNDRPSPNAHRQTFTGSGGGAEQETPSGKTDTSNESSYREIRWASMFENLLDRQLKGEEFVDKCSITYLGESFPLGIVLRDLVGGGRRPQLHHPGPPYPLNEDVNKPQSLSHPPYMQPEDIAYLEAKKAFELPDKKNFDLLVGVFLDRVFPLYPIVIRQELMEQHHSATMPWILAHAICFMAATFCPIHILYRCGFEGRRQARWIFYSKAKALFDIGYEENKIVLLQVSIMMSFWGGGPNNFWNFYGWISAGVTIAETLGCHRSMDGANIKPQDRSLIKRLWWILMIRDTGCAALVGRPFRISLDHCDTEPLTAEDFQHDLQSPDFAGSPYAPIFGDYQIETTKLSLILRRIMVTRYFPKSDKTADPSSLKQLLTDWRSGLPSSLEWSDAVTKYTNIFASTLSVLYNHMMILSQLSCPPEPEQGTSETAYTGQPVGEDILLLSAQRIAATACAVITKSDILLVPHELLHGIFTAGVVFYMQKRSSNPLKAQLGMSGLTNCQMVLHEAWEFWDSSPWVTQLLDKVLYTPSICRDSSVGGEDGAPNMSDLLNNTGMFQGSEPVDPVYDMWHIHPVLGSLFDATPNASNEPMAPIFGDWLGQQPEFAP